MMTHGPDYFGPRAQARDRRARQGGDPYLPLVTFGISAAVCILVIGCLLGKWLTEVPL